MNLDQQIIEPGKWVDKKTSDTIIVTGVRVNASNNQIMVEFDSNSFRLMLINILSGQPISKFVMEIDEFYERYEKVEHRPTNY